MIRRILFGALAALFFAVPAFAQMPSIGMGGRPGPISSASVIAALGYTPVNKAGDTMTGSLVMGGGVQLTTSGAGVIGAGFGLDQNALGDIVSRATGRIGFVPSTNITVAPDTAISRTAAATLAVGNGTQGDFSGTIKAEHGTFVGDGSGSINIGTAGVDQSATINATTNFYLRSTGAISLGPNGGTDKARFSQVTGSVYAFELNNIGMYTWSSDGTSFGTIDTGLSRTAAGTLAIGNGTQGNNSGTLDVSSGQVRASSAVIGTIFATSSASGQMPFRNAAETAAVTLDFNTNNVWKFLQSDGATLANINAGAVIIPGGSSSAADLQLAGQAGTGVFLGSNTVNFTTGGTNRLAISTGSITTVLPIVPASAGSTSLGSVSLPFLATTTRSIGSDGDLNVLNSSSSSMWRFTNLGNIVNTSANTQVIGWSNAGSGTLDTGISRGAAATFDFGNGTAQDVSGTVVAAHATLNALANSATTSAVCYNTSTGVLTYDGTIGTCNTSALWRKDRLAPIAAAAVDGLYALRVEAWKYKQKYIDSGEADARVHVGLYADDVEKLDKRCVGYKNGVIQNYDDRCVLAYVIAGLKQLKSEIAALRNGQ